MSHARAYTCEFIAWEMSIRLFVSGLECIQRIPEQLVSCTVEGSLSQTYFVRLTPVWLFAKAVNISVTQHVVCGCLEVRKNIKRYCERTIHLKNWSSPVHANVPILAIKQKKKKKARK